MRCPRRRRTAAALCLAAAALPHPASAVAAVDPQEALGTLHDAIPGDLGAALRAYLMAEARTAVGDHVGAAAGYREALRAAFAEPDAIGRDVALASILQLRRGLQIHPRAWTIPAVDPADRVPVPDPGWLPVVFEIHELRGDLRYIEADVEGARGAAAERGCLLEWIGIGPEGPTALDHWRRSAPPGWLLHPPAWGPPADHPARPERIWRPRVHVCNLTLGKQGESRPGVLRISTVVEAPEGMLAAALRVMTLNPFLVLVDGTEVVHVDRFREPAGAVNDFHLSMPPGRHRLDIQFASPSGRPTVSVAMLGIGADGKPVALPQSSDLSVETPPAFTGTARRIDPPAGEGWGALAAIDVAHISGRTETAARAVERLAASDFGRDNPLVLLRAARIVLSDPTLTQTEGRMRSAGYLDRLGPPAEGLVTPRLLRAGWALEDADLDDAIDILQEAAAAFPDEPEVLRRLARAFIDRGWVEEARRTIDSLGAVAEGSCLPEEMALALAYEVGRYEEIVRAADAVVACLPSSFAKLGALRMMQRWDEAIEEAERLAPLHSDPDHAEWTVLGLRLQRGDTDGMEEVLRARLARNPRDAAALAALADLLARDGRTGEAIRLHDELLARTGEAANAGALRTVSALLGVDPFSALRIDARQAIAAYEARRPPREPPSTQVLDQTVSRIFPDGSIRTVTHTVLKLSSQEAIDAHGQAGGGAGGGLVLARTIAPDGSITDAVGIARGAATSFPNLSPGCYVDMLSVRHAEAAPTLQGGTDHWRFYFRGQNEAMARSELVLVAPSDYPLDVSPRADPPDPVVAAAAGLSVRRWTAFDEPPIHPEPMAVSADAYVPSVRAARGFTWARSLASLADNLYAGEYLPIEAAQFARARCAGLRGRECARALYDWLLDTIEQGGFGDSLAATFQRKAGSRSRLMHAMLGAAGIDADLLLATSIDRDRTPSEIAEPSRYYHPVLFAAGTWFTVEHDEAPFGFLPPEIRGMPAVRLYPRVEGVHETILPDAAPGHDGLAATFDLDVDAATGEVKASGEMSLRGAPAADVREALLRRSPADRENDLTTAFVSPTFPGADVEEVSIDGLDDREAPLVIRFAARVPGFAARRGDRLILPPLVPQRLSGGYAPLPVVEHPALAFPPAAIDVRATIRAPGYAAGPHPGASVDRSGVRFSQAFERTDSGVSVRRNLSVSMARIEPPDYPAFADAIRRAESLWNVPLELRREP